MEKGHGSIKGGNREHGLILSYEERKPLKPLLVLALPCFHGTHVHSESKETLNNRLEEWRTVLKHKCLKISRSKTKTYLAFVVNLRHLNSVTL
ncbi:hypothetical protein L1987_06287 [Smallanthus sonchifolius]|uniref:Uncharacterized protein n=1 Tax=Smallanthus sonchifolius TaxID=185202 RepID=A0ACB9JXV9_9ASTR|nr:hypothetical protein L1987_06287 [Smallanthus sonchifolius]